MPEADTPAICATFADTLATIIATLAELDALEARGNASAEPVQKNCPPSIPLFVSPAAGELPACSRNKMLYTPAAVIPVGKAPS